MNAPSRRTMCDEHLARGLDHLVRPAQKPLVDGIDGEKAVQEYAELCGVDPAVEQLRFSCLPGQDMKESEPRRVTVLEVLQLLEQHDRAGRPVAVKERDRAVGLTLEYGRRDGQDRGDPRARGDQRVVLGLRWLEVGEEPASRGHDVKNRTGREIVLGPLGERSAGKS